MNLSKVQQHGIPLSSILEKENFGKIPSLTDTEVLPIEMPVDIHQASRVQQQAGSQGMVASGSIPPVNHVTIPKHRRFNVLARTSFPPSTDISSISSNTSSLTNSGSPVSPTQATASVASDGVVMRSNLNGSRACKARLGSVRKHVMSFMEYDTENDSTCSSQRSSFRTPAEAYLPGRQTRVA